MERQKSNLEFRLMSFFFILRDLVSPRINILKEVGIKPGFSVLDYGCGPGGYILPLAHLVGKSGMIYALDINPLAIQAVRNMANKKRLTNMKAILSDGKTGLPDESLDVILLYDVFHGLKDPEAVLRELHRVLKPEGILSFSDHHLAEKEIIAGITGAGLFKLSGKGGRTFSFSKK